MPQVLSQSVSMLAPTNKYSKGSKKVKNSRKNVTKK